MNINLGEAARGLREALGINQRRAAEELGISNVHLCNIEKNRSQPSPDLLERYQEKWGVDLYVYAWCQNGDVSKLPKSMQTAANALVKGWQQRVEEAVERRREPNA